MVHKLPCRTFLRVRAVRVMEEPYFEIVLITQKRFRIVKLIN